MKNGNKIFTALGIGLAGGALLGVLFAPRKGKETRNLIAKKASRLPRDLSKELQEGQKKLGSLKDTFRERVNGLNRKTEEPV
jgi:gas vesicle protein